MGRRPLGPSASSNEQFSEASLGVTTKEHVPSAERAMLLASATEIVELPEHVVEVCVVEI